MQAKCTTTPWRVPCDYTVNGRPRILVPLRVVKKKIHVAAHKTFPRLMLTCGTMTTFPFFGEAIQLCNSTTMKERKNYSTGAELRSVGNTLCCVCHLHSLLSLLVLSEHSDLYALLLTVAQSPTNHCADAVFAEKTPIVTHVSFRLFSYIARNARGTCSPVQKTHNKPQHIPMERRCPHWKGENIA